jgi:hypothetical protein
MLGIKLVIISFWLVQIVILAAMAIAFIDWWRNR